MATAALLTQVSMRPNAATAAAAIDSTSCGFDTSAATWIAPAGVPDLVDGLAQVALVAGGQRDRRATCAAFFAVTSPIPLDAPVMTTTWSRRGFSLTVMLLTP